MLRKLPEQVGVGFGNVVVFGNNIVKSIQISQYYVVFYLYVFSVAEEQNGKLLFVFTCCSGSRPF